MNKISAVCFHNFFETLSSIHQYNTRQASKGDIFMTRENTYLYGLRSIRYAGAKAWNDVPHLIKLSPTSMIFRVKLKSHLFSSNYQVD